MREAPVPRASAIVVLGSSSLGEFAQQASVPGAPAQGETVREAGASVPTVPVMSVQGLFAPVPPFLRTSVQELFVHGAPVPRAAFAQQAPVPQGFVLGPSVQGPSVPG